MKVVVYGASDDLIEIEGDLSEEFGAYDSGEPKTRFLAFSDGTLLSIVYGIDGAYWRINRMVAGQATYEKHEATYDDGDYSDRVTLTGDNLRWVVLGEHCERAKT